MALLLGIESSSEYCTVLLCENGEYEEIHSHKGNDLGVIAQEVEKIIPEVVVGENGDKAVAYGNLVAVLIEAIKELSEKVEKLENK